jgi:hypothetical protein
MQTMLTVLTQNPPPYVFGSSAGRPAQIAVSSFGGGRGGNYLCLLGARSSSLAQAVDDLHGIGRLHSKRKLAAILQHH